MRLKLIRQFIKLINKKEFWHKINRQMVFVQKRIHVYISKSLSFEKYCHVVKSHFI